MRYMLTAVTYAMMAMSALMFLKSIDRAAEVDDLKSHIRSQREAIVFLLAFSDKAVSECAMNVGTFDDLLKNSSYAHRAFRLNDQLAFGPFLVQKKNNCISHIGHVSSPM